MARRDASARIYLARGCAAAIQGGMGECAQRPALEGLIPWGAVRNTPWAAAHGRPRTRSRTRATPLPHPSSKAAMPLWAPTSVGRHPPPSRCVVAAAPTQATSTAAARCSLRRWCSWRAPTPRTWWRSRPSARCLARPTRAPSRYASGARMRPSLAGSHHSLARKQSRLCPAMAPRAPNRLRAEPCPPHLAGAGAVPFHHPGPCVRALVCVACRLAPSELELQDVAVQGRLLAGSWQMVMSMADAQPSVPEHAFPAPHPALTDQQGAEPPPAHAPTQLELASSSPPQSSRPLGPECRDQRCARRPASAVSCRACVRDAGGGMSESGSGAGGAAGTLFGRMLSRVLNNLQARSASLVAAGAKTASEWRRTRARSGPDRMCKWEPGVSMVLRCASHSREASLSGKRTQEGGDEGGALWPFPRRRDPRGARVEHQLQRAPGGDGDGQAHAARAAERAHGRCAAPAPLRSARRRTALHSPRLESSCFFAGLTLSTRTRTSRELPRTPQCLRRTFWAPSSAATWPRRWSGCS